MMAFIDNLLVFATENVHAEGRVPADGGCPLTDRISDDGSFLCRRCNPCAGGGLMLRGGRLGFGRPLRHRPFYLSPKRHHPFITEGTRFYHRREAPEPWHGSTG